MKSVLLLGTLLLLLSGQTIDQARVAPFQIKTELYMGLSDKEGKPISKRSWETFKNTHLVSILAGYTVLESEGYWKNEQGITYSENSVVVVYVHDSSPEESQKINLLIQLYKEKFNQESVLQVDTEVVYRFK